MLAELLSSLPGSETLDGKLVRRMAVGERKALAELYELHSAGLFRYLLRLVGERGAAEELLQDVFLAAWRGAAGYEGRAKVSTWLYKIAHNRAVSRLRYRRRAEEELTLEAAAEVFEDPSSGPEEAALREATRGEISAALGTLSPIHREVLELTFECSFSYPEISEITGVPIGTVKSRASHARRMLRTVLKARGFEREV